MNPVDFGIALALYLVGVALRAWRWQGLLAVLGQHARLTRLTELYFVGMFFNLVLPTSVGGDAVRVWYLARLERGRPAPGRATAAFLSVLAERGSGVVVLAVVACVAALLCPVPLPAWVRLAVLAVGCGLGAGVLTLALLAWWAPRGRGRLLQGLAGAGMMPISQAAILDMWPQRLMPRVMAMWSAVIMVGPILGPTLGGLLTEHFSWRWVFYVNVPFGVLAFALVYLTLERDAGGLQRPFDFLGFAALVLGTGAIQLMADRGPTCAWATT